MRFKSLLHDGKFRIVTVVEDGEDDFEDDVFIQHQCDSKDSCDMMSYDDPNGGWIYCRYSDSNCSSCGEPVPYTMTGFMAMINWSP